MDASPESRLRPTACVRTTARQRDDSDAYRLVYMPRLADAVHVLHALQKKVQATLKTGHQVGKSSALPSSKVTMSKTTARTDRFDSAWDALADSTEDAANLKMRADFMRKIAAVGSSYRYRHFRRGSGVQRPNRGHCRKRDSGRRSLRELSRHDGWDHGVESHTLPCGDLCCGRAAEDPF